MINAKRVKDTYICVYMVSGAHLHNPFARMMQGHRAKHLWKKFGLLICAKPRPRRRNWAILRLILGHVAAGRFKIA